MLLVVEIPTIDVRSLLDVPTGRAGAPDWMWLPVHGNEFVRGLGPVKQRPRGGIEPWPAEGFLVQCRASIRFEVTRLRQASPRLQPVFRRYFSDGRVGRLEVGFRSTPAGGHDADLDPTSAALAAVSVRARLRGATEDHPLLAFGDQLAGYVLSATTLTHPRSGVRPDRVEGWWMQHGAPLVLCEVRRDELSGRVSKAARVASRELTTRASGGAYVEQYWQTVDSTRVSMWVLMFGPDANSDSVRRLRIHITRLHAEHEALRTVLRLCDKRQLDLTSDRVRDYLDERTSLLLRKKVAGFPQKQLLELVLDQWQRGYVDDLMTMHAVERELESKGLRRKVEALKLLGGPGELRGGAVVRQIIVESGGNLTVKDQSVNISGKNVNAAGIITGDHNTQTIGSISQTNLVEMTADLVKTVEALRGELNDDDFAEGSDYATAIQDEAAKPEPDKGKLRRFLAKVTEWAKKIGPPALAVAATAAQIVAVL